MTAWYNVVWPCGFNQQKEPTPAAVQAPMDDWDDDGNASSASKDIDSDATLMDVNSEILDVSHSSVLGKPHPPPYKKKVVPIVKLESSSPVAPKSPSAVKVGPKGAPKAKTPVAGVKAAVVVPVVVLDGGKEPKKKATLMKPSKKTRLGTKIGDDTDSQQTTGLRRRHKTRTRNLRSKRKQQAVPVPVPKAAPIPGSPPVYNKVQPKVNAPKAS